MGTKPVLCQQRDGVDSAYQLPDFSYQMKKVFDVSWKPLCFASWFPTLISCSPNLSRVYIRLCEHGNHFTFLHWLP